MEHIRRLLLEPRMHALYRAQLVEMSRLRHHALVERLNWLEINEPDGLDIDQDDTTNTTYISSFNQSGAVLGRSRLNPSTGPNLGTHSFGQYATFRRPPGGPDTPEGARNCVDIENYDRIGSRSRARNHQKLLYLRATCTNLALRMMLKVVARDAGMETSFHRSCAELAGALCDHDVIVLGRCDARGERSAAWELLESLPSGSALIFVTDPPEAARADKLGQLALTLPVTRFDLEIYIDALLTMAKARMLRDETP